MFSVIIIIVVRLPTRTDATGGGGDIVALLFPIRSPSVYPRVIGIQTFLDRLPYIARRRVLPRTFVHP